MAALSDALPPGARKWHTHSPRAVAPSHTLLDLPLPELANALHAATSPLPYALGVLANNRALPLVYLSEAAALSRGPSVSPGWYVAVAPGDMKFELVLTRVHPLLHDARLPAGVDVAADIIVGGVRVSKGGYRVSRECTELRVRGFREALRFGQGMVAGRETVRPFVVRRARTAELGGCSSSGDGDAGDISLVVFSNKLRAAGRRKMRDAQSCVRAVRTVDECEAVKYGRSIAVDAADTLVDHAAPRASYYVPRDGAKVEGTVTVYLREKYWLESRRICDSRGLAWRPSLGSIRVGVDPVNRPAVDRPGAAVVTRALAKRVGEVEDVQEEEASEVPVKRVREDLSLDSVAKKRCVKDLFNLTGKTVTKGFP